MIVFISTSAHTYTHKQVEEQASGFKARVATYSSMFKIPEPPKAAYVFTDLDRLAPAGLRTAAQLYRGLKDRGFPALNDPVRFMGRWGLLRALHAAGINSFNAYRAEEHVRPQRWPVFVRAEGTHDAPLSDLLHDWDEVRRAIDRAVAGGTPFSQLLVIEFAAEPVAPGLYRKLASFRIGARDIAHSCVHDSTWIVKYGSKGIATEELYREELRIVHENPHASELARVFDLAGTEYGRVDFGLVGGRVQVYEINTNPDVKFATEHPSPLRLETYRAFRENYFDALRALDPG